jgi:EF-hand domain pair
MTEVSRTMLAHGLVVLTTTAGLLLAAPSYAQNNAPAAPPAASSGQPTPPPGGPGPGRWSRHGEHGGHGLKAMDSDGDGLISRAEFDAAGKKMAEQRAKFFDMADTNKDGKLSRDEMAALRHQHRRGPPPAQPGQAPNNAPAK